MRRVAGVILAGGQSSRMGGGDKGLLELSGKTLLHHVVERLLPQVTALALNANGDPQRFDSYSLTIFPDDAFEGIGPLAGILAGMRWARMHDAHITHIATAAADTPFLPRNLVTHLAAALDTEDAQIAIAASHGRTHPTFGLWPINLADDLAAYLETGESTRVTAYAGGRQRTIQVDFLEANTDDPFFNINTPDDLTAAKHILQKAAS